MKNKLLLFLLMCLIAVPCAAGKTQKNKKTTTAAAKNVTLNINARILVARKTKNGKNKTANARLKKCEKELTSFLDYNDYKVVKTGSKSTKLKSSFKINFSKGRSVSITPISNDNGRIKSRVIWNIPGKKGWSTTLNFKQGKRSIVSGPKDNNGAMYLMSLEIK